MFYSRKINPETRKLKCGNANGQTKEQAVRKEYLRKLGDEDEIQFSHDTFSAADAICWAPGRTIGNIAVSSEEAFGMFEGSSGDDAILPCQIIPAGKFRMAPNDGTAKPIKFTGAPRLITLRRLNPVKSSAVII